MHTYDAATNTHTLYGFGRIRVRTQTAVTGQQAVATSVTTYGAALGLGEGNTGLAVGYQNRDRLLVFSPDADVQVTYSATDVFHAHLDAPVASGPSLFAP